MSLRRDAEERQEGGGFQECYLVEFGIAARHFNAIARNLEGKIDSVKGLLPPRIQETELAIARAKKGNLQIQERKQGAPEETQAFQSGDQA